MKYAVNIFIATIFFGSIFASEQTYSTPPGSPSSSEYSEKDLEIMSGVLGIPTPDIPTYLAEQKAALESHQEKKRKRTHSNPETPSSTIKKCLSPNEECIEQEKKEAEKKDRKRKHDVDSEEALTEAFEKLTVKKQHATNTQNEKSLEDYEQAETQTLEQVMTAVVIQDVNLLNELLKECKDNGYNFRKNLLENTQLNLADLADGHPEILIVLANNGLAPSKEDKPLPLRERKV